MHCHYKRPSVFPPKGNGHLQWTFSMSIMYMHKGLHIVRIALCSDKQSYVVCYHWNLSFGYWNQHKRETLGDYMEIS